MRPITFFLLLLIGCAGIHGERDERGNECTRGHRSLSNQAGAFDRAVWGGRARPGELKFGSTGIGTGTHIGVEKFNQAAGIKALHVPPLPSDSNADTIANAIAGHFTYYLVPISLALPYIRDGTLVALGVSTARRSPLLPEVPTIAEAGVAGFDFPIWYGLWAPAGNPAGVIV